MILKKINFDVKKLTTDPKSDQESSYFPLEVMVKAIRFLNEDLDDGVLENLSLLHLSRSQIGVLFGIKISEHGQTPSKESLKKSREDKKNQVKKMDPKVRQAIVN